MTLAIEGETVSNQSYYSTPNIMGYRELRKLILELASRPQGIRSPELAKRINQPLSHASSQLRRLVKQGILKYAAPKRKTTAKGGQVGKTYYVVVTSYGQVTKACNPTALSEALGYPTRKSNELR